MGIQGSHHCPPLPDSSFGNYGAYVRALAQHGHEAHGSPLLRTCSRYTPPLRPDEVWRHWCDSQFGHNDREKRFACMDIYNRLEDVLQIRLGL